MHRELAYIGSKVAAPIELTGSTVKKSPTKTPSTQGKWDNLIDKTRNSDRIKSPEAVAHRRQDNNNAKRTINPELNADEYQQKTRKITKKPSNAFDPGNILNLLKKSGTVEDIHRTKKIIPEKKQTEEYFNITPQSKGIKNGEKKKVNEKKLAEYSSHIPNLSSPAGQDKTDETPTRSAKSPSANKEKKQYYLKSAIPGLSCGDETKREFHDRDEIKIMQSANSPRMAKHLASTFMDQPLQPQTARSRKDPNKQNYVSYEDDNKLHPFTKGKKTAYPVYTERNTSQILRPETSAAQYSPRYGGMEPLDALCPGRRNIHPQHVVNNIISPPEPRVTQRASTAFSFRTFSSKIF